MKSAPTAPLALGIVAQHMEDAAFTWHHRDRLTHAPHVALRHLAAFDERLLAHLDGLMLAGSRALGSAREAINPSGGPEFFPAFFLALHAGLAEDIEFLLALISQTTKGPCPLAAALAWLEPQHALPVARVLATAPQSLARRIAVTGLVAHGAPGNQLKAMLADPHPLPRARALRAAGQLGRRDPVLQLAAALDDTDASCRFAAAWSLTRLGDPRGLGPLRLFVNPDFPLAHAALQLALRATEPARAMAWLRALAVDPRTLRLVITGAGVLGDPAFVLWLLGQMRQPALARLAGEAFTMITGTDLTAEALEGERPAGFESGPNDDPDDLNVALDPDEDLPWPDPVRVEAWWARNRDRFPPGQRLLLGQPLTPPHLMHVLRHRLQRQRAAAALELALLNPEQPIFDVRAPARRQMQQLAAAASSMPT